ncbi:cystatin-POGU1-like [Perca flavescens]|uniref:cystatin-POGU1-like n=1 Tax=Perca flavescens TaxID=8167 RepID=UPI00106E02BA|nr:cystatin-POGU1-like [Perca flavescens]
MMFVWFCVVVCAFTGRFVTEQQPLLGVPQKVFVNDPKVLDSARFAVAEFNKANEEKMCDYKIVKITSAEIQSIQVFIPAFNYILEMHLRCTTSKKGNSAANKPCDCHCEPKELKCHFTVYYSLEHPSALSQNQCESFVNH